MHWCATTNSAFAGLRLPPPIEWVNAAVIIDLSRYEMAGVESAMKRVSTGISGILGAVILGAGVFGAAPADAQYLPPTANLLLRYDTDGNGVVSRAEMDAGLRADYALADANSDGCIDSDEIRAENDRRLERDAGVASPIRDWNLDGCVNMNEFGSSIRSYFSFADRSKDDQVNTAELRGPSMPITLPTPPGGGGANSGNNNNNNRDQAQPQGVVSASPSILDPSSPDYYGR